MALAFVAGAHTSSASATRVGEADYLTKGERLTVKVRPADSGSSGYHWRVANKRSVLSLSSSRPSGDGKRQVLAFAARRTGFTPLKLQYVSPGRDRKVAKTHRAYVVVNGAQPAPECGAGSMILDNSVARVFSISRSALVYRPDSVGYTLYRFRYDDYYACESAGGPAYPLRPGRGATPGPDQLYNFTLNGSVLGWVFAEAFCPPAFGGDCAGTPRHRVRSTDLHTGKLIRDAQVGNCAMQPDCTNYVSGLVVSPAGGLAWIEGRSGSEPFSVHRSDLAAAPGSDVASDEETIGENDPGSVDATSLQYDGTAFSYVRDGQRYRAPLR